MNTDKLMELVEALIEEADGMLSINNRTLGRGAVRIQANSVHFFGKKLEAVRAELAAVRALGTARQSEGVGKVFGMEVAHNPKLPPDSFVLVPREPTEAMLAAARDERDRRIDYMLKPSFRGTWAAMLAAAPGGEGEG